MSDTSTLPEMSDADRETALAKAAAARRERAEIKALLKTGSLTLEEVFDRAESNDIVAGTKFYPRCLARERSRRSV